MAESDDDLAADGSTPSQRELDASIQGDQIANTLRWQGQLMEAKRQVQTRVAHGGSQGVGRELLGQIDDMIQGEGFDADAAAQLGKDMDSFIHTGVGAASQSKPASTPTGTTTPTGTRPRPRPSTPASRQSDRERQLDPNTPVSELREIRARLKAVGE